ncbi:MAG: 50S ribosomal protein L32 [Saprospiraceae bacterium]|nr:50S ribosomal protein L32 [Saprospiraceae bacterium]
MAHPKSRISKQRKRKRRTHYKIDKSPNVSICQVTGQPHLRHNAHWHDGKLYYRGRVFIDNTEEVVEVDGGEDPVVDTTPNTEE